MENKQATTTMRGITKSALSAVGAIAVVKTAPVLAAGIVIGAALSKADQIKEYITGLKEEYEQYCAEAAEAAAAAEKEDDLFEHADHLCGEQPSGEGGTDANKQEKMEKILAFIEEILET